MGRIVLFLFVVFIGVSLWASDSIVVKTQPRSVVMTQRFSDSLALHSDSVKLENLRLPPLSIFLESVYEHPSLQIYQTYKDEEAARLKVTKREWLNYFRAVGQLQYGHNSVVLSPDPAITNQSYGFEPRMYYNVGMAISVPLGDLAGREGRIKAQEARLKRVGYEYEVSLEERRLRILEAYSMVTQLITVMKAKADAAALYNAQMKISEHNYINGKITIVELSLERARRSNAVVSYEEGKASLQNAITLLEMLTNVKITK